MPYLRDQPIYGFKARGLDGVTEPHHSTEEMARDYVREMRAIQPDGPYLLCGECVGGIVAYEMAQQLHGEGHQVGLVAMMDTDLPTEEAWALVENHSRRRRNQRLAGHWKKFRKLPATERAAMVARLFALAALITIVPPLN